ncbi:hypothetical protein DITRI_Ditri19aG0068800 [Diplodiscus trichospermus]
MVNDMRYMETTCERAPALLISHKKPSTCPRLETIFEEGSELKLEVGQKTLLFSVLIPVSLSIVFCCIETLFDVGI